MRDRQPRRRDRPRIRESGQAAHAPGPSPTDSVLQLQRTIGNRATARLLSRADSDLPFAPAALQRAFNPGTTVDTSGGTWTNKIYKEHANTETKGVDIHVVFTPSEAIDADKIGLTQSIISLKEGVAEHIVPETDRGGRAKEVNETVDQSGAKIDRDRNTKLAQVNAVDADLKEMPVQNTNPIYGASIPRDGQTLADTEVSEDQIRGGKNALGSGHGGKDVKAAELYDEPRRKIPLLKNSEQRFETTAVAIAGKDTGKYYGSVEWGWATNGDSTFGGIDFAKKQDGDPSETFAAARKKWNASSAMTSPKLDFLNPEPKRANLPLPVDK